MHIFKSILAKRRSVFSKRGLLLAEARGQTRLKFGAIEASNAAHHGSRGIAWLDALFSDARFTARALLCERMFAATVILILGVALGLNLTAFRVLDTIVFRSYPLVKENRRILYLNEQYPTPGCCVSYFDFEQWRKQARSFENMAFFGRKSITVREGENDRELWVYPITSDTFGLLGVRPALGRDFHPSDEVPGAAPVVIITHRYWKTELGGRGDVIGQRIRISGVPTSIIGVMPEGFDFPWRMDFYLPLEQTAELHRRGVANGGLAFGRLANGASEKSARAELDAISARLAREFPDTNRGVRPVVHNYLESLAGSDAPFLYGSMWLGACFVLWIAGANVANLALARAQSRARELSTRLALGAGRARVVQQLFLENLILATAAGLLAWWTAGWSTSVWAAATTTPDQVFDYSVSFGTVVYLIGVTLAAAGITTVAPVARVWRLNVNGALKSETRSSTISRRAKYVSAALVAGQMALAIVLLAGAGVLGHSLWKVLSADIGVKHPENVLVGKIALPQTKYPTSESRTAFSEALRSRLGAVPGVESAAISDARPVDDFEPQLFELDAQTGSIHGVPIFAASPGYFRTIGAALRAGRDFNESDRSHAPLVAIVNQRFAETYFPGQNAIGRRFRLYHKADADSGQWRTIIGVVSNVMQNEWTRQHFVPAAYLPFAQEPTAFVWFYARTPGASEGMAAAIRTRVRQTDPHLKISDFSTLKASVGLQPSGSNYRELELVHQAAVAPVFAAIGLLLAAIGLYAVVARSVGQRTKEIGVRVALGAAPRDVGRLVLREGMAPVAVGLLLGLAASLAVNRILQAQLVGISPYDPLTLALAPLILTLVALIGCILPMRQAVRVDPAVALRHD